MTLNPTEIPKRFYKALKQSSKGHDYEWVDARKIYEDALLEVPLPPSPPSLIPNSTYTVHIAGTTVKARNNRTELVDFTADSEVNAASAVQDAINNIQNIVDAGLDTAQGASVFMMAGKYKLLTEILLHKIAGTGNAGRNAINLIGEGNGTYLSFEPTSSLTNGIRMKGNFNRLANMLIEVNENVVNAVKGEGPPLSAPGQYNWQALDWVTICGRDTTIPEGGANTLIPGGVTIPGQVGLYMQGDSSEDSFFTANWVVTNCKFFALETGIKIIGDNADMSHFDNLHFGGCEIPMIIEGVQHNCNNFRIEGGGGTVDESHFPEIFNLLQGAATTGSIGIWIRENAASGVGGNINFLSDINIELHKLNSIGVLIEDGCNNNKIANIYNSSNDGMSKHLIVDNNKTPGANFVDTPVLGIGRISQQRRRFGGMTFGFNRLGTEEGILRGNVHSINNGVVDSDLVTTGFTSGPFGTLQTTTAVNDVACLYYNNAISGNSIIKDQRPTLYVRFIPNSLANIRAFIGLWDQFAAPLGSSDLLANRRGIGLYLDTSVSNNWKTMHNDNSVSSTIADFPTETMFGNATYGPNALNSGFVNAVTITYNPANANNPDIQNGPTANVLHHGLAYAWKSTNVQSAGNFGFLIYLENLTEGASRTLRLFDIELGVTIR